MTKKTILGLAAFIAATMTQAGYAQTSAARASGGDKTDFALFDGTDPVALEAGVACGAQRGQSGQAIPFTYFVTVSNWSPSVQVIRVRYNDNQEIARYQVPPNSSFSFSQAAGSTTGVDDVIRVVAETAPPSGLAGSMSFSSSAAAQPHPELGGNSFCVTLLVNP
jgi:hypothetical protein